MVEKMKVFALGTFPTRKAANMRRHSNEFEWEILVGEVYQSIRLDLFDQINPMTRWLGLSKVEVA